MLIQQKKTARHEMFYVEEDGKILAELVYKITPEHRMEIEHTEVNDSLQGKHVGHELVSHAVEYARANNLKIVPLCSFARSVFKQDTGIGDVLA